MATPKSTQIRPLLQKLNRAQKELVEVIHAQPAGDPTEFEQHLLDFNLRLIEEIEDLETLIS